jgi:hypothetical protein
MWVRTRSPMNNSYSSFPAPVLFKCRSNRSSAIDTNSSYHFGLSVLSPPIKSRAARRGSNAKRTRRCLSPTFPRNSFMFPCRELTITSAWGRDNVGPRSSSRSTLAAITCCSSSERSPHQTSNSPVNSTSHATTSLCSIWNTPSREYSGRFPSRFMGGPRAPSSERENGEGSRSTRPHPSY